jgi:transposase-like protein
MEASSIMLLAYFWLAGDSHQTIMNKTKHSQHTVTNFLSDFRDLVSSDLKEQKQKIGGEGVIVEIDESKFGKRKYHKGHKVEGVWVFGGVERTPEHRMFAVSVPNRKDETLLSIITENILPGSIIYSDCWAGYNEIKERLPMAHWTVNHSKNFKDPDTGVHTNTIEGTWHGLKIKISNRNRTANGINKHLFEAIWRRNNSSNLWAAFISCLANTSYKS